MTARERDRPNEHSAWGPTVELERRVLAAADHRLKRKLRGIEGAFEVYRLADIYINTADPPVLPTYAPYFRPDRLSEPFFYRLCWIFQALHQSYQDQSGASVLKARVSDERLLIIVQLIEHELRKCIEHRVPHSLEQPASVRSDVRGRRWKEHAKHEWGWHRTPSFRQELAYLRRRLSPEPCSQKRFNSRARQRVLRALSPLEKERVLQYEKSRLSQIVPQDENTQSQKLSAWRSTSPALKKKIILEGGGPPFNPVNYDWSETLGVIRRLERTPSERRGRPEDTHIDDFVYFAVRMHRCISDIQVYSSGWSEHTPDPLIEFLDRIASRYKIATQKSRISYRIKGIPEQIRLKRASKVL